jgi:nitroreductase
VLTRRQHNALRMAADRARLAPSVHNSQPWRLDLFADRLEVRLDTARRLPVLDPTGRDLVLSVGAALLNARVGLAAGRAGEEVSRFPDPARPDLVAVLRPVAYPPAAALAALDPLVPLRRSHRGVFSGGAPEQLVEELEAAAAAEGADLVPVDRSQRPAVARLARAAADAQDADSDHRRELRSWTSRPPGQRDGVQVEPRWVGRRGGDELTLRTFRPDRSPAGALPPAGPLPPGAADPETLLVLATAGDEPVDWLRAGEALERVLLAAVRRGWQVGLATQPVEVPVTRAELGALVTPGRSPHVLLRIGRAVPAAGPDVRRRTADVLRDWTAYPRGPGEQIGLPVPDDGQRTGPAPRGPSQVPGDGGFGP